MTSLKWSDCDAAEGLTGDVSPDDPRGRGDVLAQLVEERRRHKVSGELQAGGDPHPLEDRLANGRWIRRDDELGQARARVERGVADVLHVRWDDQLRQR